MTESRIQLLPDHIANQIAAGEVIQRPASAVKELLENAVDAGATEVQLIVVDAGKTLIQVVDNGSGMSELDARMAFERHATSKIRQIDDLFQIRTMGFRGEALASIAAVAQVELKTKRREDAAGTRVELEHSAVVLQEPIAMADGTSIAMKNLFFNVPARRNFLKSNAAEMRHIVEEFIRVAMAFPHVFFSLTHNGQQQYFLERGTLKQRLVQVLGNTYQSKLVPVQEQTDYLNITGFVGKPETAKKTRGDQYFFVNNRFIRSGYLNHAIMQAFDSMIPKDSFPMYALYIDLDPAQVDINVHPTKQEIKFEDEKIVYAFVQSAVKHALAQFSITPTLDFELDAGIQQLDAVSKPFSPELVDETKRSSLYQGFTQKNQAFFIERSSSGVGASGGTGGWKSLMQEVDQQQAGAGMLPMPDIVPEQAPTQHAMLDIQEVVDNVDPLVLAGGFILLQDAQGFLLLHQQNVHERVLYERYQQALDGQPMASQRSMFPSTWSLSPADAPMLMELLPDLELLGYQIEPFGTDTCIIHGIPADLEPGDEVQAIERMLEQYKHFSLDLRFSRREKLVRSLATQRAIRPNKALSVAEAKVLVSEWKQTETPGATPNGKPTFQRLDRGDLEKYFGR